MILKNKKLLIITSLLTLLPIPVGLLLWNKFPETMAIHFGITGQADGYASPSFAVFVLPLILLAFHWVCILSTAFDKGNKNRNQKLQSIMLWTIPLIGNLSICGIYALALGWKFSPVAWTVIPMGLLFACATIVGRRMERKWEHPRIPLHKHTKRRNRQQRHHCDTHYTNVQQCYIVRRRHPLLTDN